MNGKREMIKELTNSAWSILSKYENDERDGLLSRGEAQETAISRIQYLRYGEENKDYFWITDMTPVMIVHPYRNDLNGKDLTNFQDPHGKKMFVEFVETVKKSEHGYVDYMWQWKDDSLHIVPKLSYVKLFKPWNWVIGTGIYIEDAKKEITEMTRRMVWISVGISILIAFLLFYIIKQSLNIERKRREAEDELQRSKEKYLTLVEAATEGLIMLIDRKISFANAVISKMTGYDTKELIDLPLDEIISKNNNSDIIEIFSGNTIKGGKFELNLNRKNGGFVEVLVTSSTAVFYGKDVNIIIVKDISSEANPGFSSVDYQQLISTLNVGFFKASIDKKGKIIFANETAIKILGFNHLDELAEINILGLLASSEDRKSVRASLVEDGFIKNKVLKIQKKDGSIAVVAISLIVLNNTSDDGIICDGIIDDITIHESEKSISNEVIASLKASEFQIGQAVASYVKPVISINAEVELEELIQFIARKKADYAMLTNKTGDYIGIITNTDVQKRILQLKLKLDNPAYLIMSSPVIYTTQDATVFEAMYLCEEHEIHHLPVKNNKGEITGVFNVETIWQDILNSLSFLIAKIQIAETPEALKQIYAQLLVLIKPLIKSELSVKNLTAITSAFSDAAIKRIIELTISEIGEAPVDFSFICLGSEGRKEETLFTDQDNAIIYADVPKEKENHTRAYFLKLGEKVCYVLNYMGYSYCKGNIMAQNPQWCVSLTEWKKYFAHWIATPEPQNLLDATIFFDFRNCYGDESLAISLRNTINHAIEEYPTFLYHLAHNTYYTKPQQLSSNLLSSDKSADTVDLKSALAPIIMFARTYAFQHKILATSTRERLEVIKEKRIVNNSTVDEVLFIYNFLMKLRYRNQVDLLEKKLPYSNSLNVRDMIDIEVYMLKKALSMIPEFQNKVKLDFRIAT
jgi:PAS domain S-box-containing protein